MATYIASGTGIISLSPENNVRESISKRWKNLQLNDNVKEVGEVW